MGEVLHVAFVTEGSPDRTSGGSLYHRRLVDSAADHGVVARFVSVPSRRFPLAVVDGRRVLRAAVRDADVVVVDSLASNTLGPVLTARRRTLPPLVGSIHQRLGGSDHGPVRRRLTAWSDRLTWRACAAVVVPSRRLETDLRAEGMTHPAFHVVPPGHDLPAPHRAPSIHDARAGRRAAVLCVANWQPRKGILALLDAVARLPVDVVTLHLVGDEDVDDRHRRQILDRLSRADLRDRVVRHGIVPPERIGALYDAADLFALASTEEPYGIVYGEAMAAGLPVVGWDAGNLPALVDDGVEGRTLPVDDIGALTAALRELADDELTRKRLGAAAIERASQLPTWDDTARRFYAVCRSVDQNAAGVRMAAADRRVDGGTDNPKDET